MEVANSEFRHGFSASFRRVTPSTHVGRRSDPHFELGFSVTLSYHDGKEGEGTERRISPQKTVLLNKVSTGVQWRASVQFSCVRKGENLGDVS